MAFSTTKRESFVKKGVNRIVVALSDTAGNSDPFQLPDACHITIQATGVFGGGTVSVQASNDGLTFYALSTPTAVTAIGLMALVDLDQGYLHYRLALTGGDATTAVVCTVIAHIVTAGTP